MGVGARGGRRGQGGEVKIRFIAEGGDGEKGGGGAFIEEGYTFCTVCDASHKKLCNMQFSGHPSISRMYCDDLYAFDSQTDCVSVVIQR